MYCRQSARLQSRNKYHSRTEKMERSWHFQFNVQFIPWEQACLFWPNLYRPPHAQPRPLVSYLTHAQRMLIPDLNIFCSVYTWQSMVYWLGHTPDQDIIGNLLSKLGMTVNYLFFLNLGMTTGLLFDPGSISAIGFIFSNLDMTIHYMFSGQYLSWPRHDWQSILWLRRDHQWSIFWPVCNCLTSLLSNLDMTCQWSLFWPSIL